MVMNLGPLLIGLPMEPSNTEKIEVKVKTKKAPHSSPRQDRDGGFAQDMNLKSASEPVESSDSRTLDPVTDKKDLSYTSGNSEKDSSELTLESASREISNESFDDSVDEPSSGVYKEGRLNSNESAGDSIHTQNPAIYKDGDDDAAGVNYQSTEFDDFYSRKLQLDGSNQSEENFQEGIKFKKGKASRQYSQNSWRVWFIFLIFIITAFAGFVTLYQLEEQSPGSGIIFDWF